MRIYANQIRTAKIIKTGISPITDIRHTTAKKRKNGARKGIRQARNKHKNIALNIFFLLNESNSTSANLCFAFIIPHFILYSKFTDFLFYKMKNFHPTGNCPVRDVLSRLGDKWSILVLVTLNANGTMRFSDIHKTIEDISQRMLTVTLRTLESDGLVERRIYAEVPPRVEYNLTDTGRSLIPHVEALVDWALEHMAVILQNRESKEPFRVVER